MACVCSLSGSVPIFRGVSVALVTNYIPPYRVPLYRLLAERLGVEVYCFGGEGHFVPDAIRDLDSQIANAPFPAHALEHQYEAFGLARGHDAIISSLVGRIALPAAYLGARRRRRPFVLWASMWRHPRTAAHLGSFPSMRHVYRRADAIVTYGPHVSEYVTRHRGSEEGVVVAPQAVEPELFERSVSAQEVAVWREDHRLGDSALVLFVGRLVEDKGVAVLSDAWRLVRRNAALLGLVGDGDEGRREWGFGEDVVFTGRLDREQLPVAYAAADVVVVPSIETPRFLEPWGLVCNEAMSQGCPVIATTAVGAAAGGLVRDGETGLVVPAGDAVALARAIERLLDDAALRHRLAARAREVVAGYSYERAVDAFARALETARERAT
jgi:glycosyltransferase involved in cell wall biosynthesis